MNKTRQELERIANAVVAVLVAYEVDTLETVMILKLVEFYTNKTIVQAEAQEQVRAANASFESQQ